MKSLRGQFFVALVCVILGLMVAYQFRVAKIITNVSSNARINELTQQVGQLQKEKKGLEDNITELESKIQKYESDAADSSSKANILKQDLDKARILAGLTKVEGPGVVITISSQSQNLNSMESGQIYFQDLLLMVNELNASDAEAISINDQRIVSNTQIREGNGNIIINGVRFSPSNTFTIKAIGDKDTLKGAIDINGSIKDNIINEGFNIKIQDANNLVINKCIRSIDFKWAKPVKEGE